MFPFSVLDLAPITAGADAGQAFRNSLDLARQTEKWRYHRYWLAEHQNIPGIASAATSVVIAHIAGGTSKIRVGSGGIMLPNPPILRDFCRGDELAVLPGSTIKSRRCSNPVISSDS